MTIKEIKDRWNTAVKRVDYMVEEGFSDPSTVSRATIELYSVMNAVIQYLNERDSAFKEKG